MDHPRPDMADAPVAMKKRPIDHRGFYVPWFVTEKNEAGLWDFGIVTYERRARALRSRLDWVTGEPLGRHMAFVIGPMCIINRVASDPPVRLETARWSARVCPFLSRPLAKRPEMERDHDTPGTPVLTNPGLCAVYVTDNITIRDGLIHLGHPSTIEWWTKGRRASPDEIGAGFEAGAERLRAMAAREGPESIAHFHRLLSAARTIMQTAEAV
ncbi:hypothetical protein CLV77_1376 [Brevirhabdus pacifica]|nr:hypothetical protein CLV77_1376 [Brevirhabdus pacifica]